MSANPFGLPDDHVLVQAFKFLGVGIIAAASHYGIYVGLVAAGLLDPIGATLAGWVVSTAISYVLNAKYTFKADLGGWTAVKFWIVTIGGGGVNALVVLIGEQFMHYAIAGVVAIVFGASFNFTGHKLWTFPSGAPASGSEDEGSAAASGEA